MTFRQSLPTAVTMITLACGVAALEATRAGVYDLALRLILLAMVADGVDGALARRLRGTSPMGEQLDSLADIVTFGVAPAFLFSTYHGGAPAPVRFGVALAFVLTGAYRLARFHAQPAHGVFCGLPITVAGPLLAVTVAGPLSAGAREAGAVALGLAVLMVCRHPFPTFARSSRWLLPAIAAVSLPVALWPRVETLAAVAGLTLGAYVVWGLVGPLVRDDVRGMDAEEVREVVGRIP